MDNDRFSHETARVGEFRRRMVRHVLCHSCGYEPPRGLGHTRCPKCGGGCWERFVHMGKLRPDPPACRTPMTRPRAQASAAPAADPSLAG